jgi:hypothetical protein
MARPCPVCGGVCGQTWRRAVIDSVDFETAHWFGACAYDWWLDESALPNLVWARLTHADAHRVVDCDGKVHRFSDSRSALAWLAEDEYVPLREALTDGLVPPGTQPPDSRSFPHADR